MAAASSINNMMNSPILQKAKDFISKINAKTSLHRISLMSKAGLETTSQGSTRIL